MLMMLLRTVIVYFTVIISIRIMGKRQVGDMQPGELVVTVLMSELAAMPVENTDSPIYECILPVAVLVLLEYVMSKLVLHSIFFRRLMNGHSAVIIRDGEIDQSLLKKLRVSVDDLMEILRGQNVFDVSTVAYGVLETNGNLSVLLKSENQTVTRKDISIKSEKATMPIPVVTDGAVRKEELKFTHMTKETLGKILKSQGVQIKEVFLMTVDQSGKATVVKKNEEN